MVSVALISPYDPTLGKRPLNILIYYYYVDIFYFRSAFDHFIESDDVIKDVARASQRYSVHSWREDPQLVGTLRVASKGEFYGIFNKKLNQPLNYYGLITKQGSSPRGAARRRVPTLSGLANIPKPQWVLGHIRHITFRLLPVPLSTGSLLNNII